MIDDRRATRGVHDLTATSRFTDLWPLLLVLALLLWPLDIALRRVSIGRRELAAGARLGRPGSGGGAGRPAPRTATEREPARRPRAGRRRRRRGRRCCDPGGRRPRRRRPGARRRRATPAAGRPTRPRRPAAAASGASAPTAAPPSTPPATPPATAPAAEPADTMARLRDAKRRARDR